MTTVIVERLAEALEDHFFPIFAEAGLGEDPYFYVKENVSGDESDGTVVIHIEAPEQIVVLSPDHLLVILYSVYCETRCSKEWMGISESTWNGFSAWLTENLGLEEGPPPFRSFEAEALPALRAI